MASTNQLLIRHVLLPRTLATRNATGSRFGLGEGRERESAQLISNSPPRFPLLPLHCLNNREQYSNLTDAQQGWFLKAVVFCYKAKLSMLLNARSKVNMKHSDEKETEIASGSDILLTGCIEFSVAK
jgi:hypothetical protein